MGDKLLQKTGDSTERTIGFEKRFINLTTCLRSFTHLLKFDFNAAPVLRQRAILTQIIVVIEFQLLLHHMNENFINAGTNTGPHSRETKHSLKYLVSNDLRWLVLRPSI